MAPAWSPDSTTAMNSSRRARDGIDPSWHEKIGLEVSQSHDNAARRFISETSNSTVMPNNTGGKTTQLTAAQP
jgi:hypothetical protein